MKPDFAGDTLPIVVAAVVCVLFGGIIIGTAFTSCGTSETVRPHQHSIASRQTGALNLSPHDFAVIGTPDPQATTFHGYQCIGDCSGHEAGYQWAEDMEIFEPDACGGKSKSFIEGCQAWAEEHGG